LKTEWEEQIQRFTDLPYRVVFGQRHKRLQIYQSPEFFTIVNYEQMLNDAMEVNRRLHADVVILDEAQRIKNWATKTAQAVKRLQSRYAFILTGTPIENRIDELHSLMSFLNPSVLGPLFRFNRDFYVLDERGRPKEFRNLDQLHDRINPYMLRRRKAEVETELPDRTDRTYFVPLSPEQRESYADHEAQVARLMQTAKRRPLTQQEQDKLMRELAMMRMVCDTNYILDPKDRVCPKLVELKKILEECRDNADGKVIIFSEWERMIELVRELCERLDIGYALHTGSVPQLRRRAEIRLFKSEPSCRVFLSTESGSTGLNLQDASVVINCDLPWNPARLEQRIARAWRKHQTRPVTVINLVSENTIEHRMLATLASKQALAEGVLHLRGDLKEIKPVAGRQAFLNRMQQLMTSPVPPVEPPPKKKVLPVDRGLAFSQRAHEKLDGALLRCEERYPLQGAHSVLVAVVDRDAGVWRAKLASLHEEFFGKEDSDPLAPVKLEVIDRETDEALKRLIAAGLVAPAIRATRGLYPASEGAPAALSLSEEERQKASSYRAQTGRKLKMARLLESGDLPDEARQAMLEALLNLGRALAVESRLPEPVESKDILLAPASHCWKESLPAIQEFVMSPEIPAKSVSQEIERFLQPA
jgi:superfamily II DNA or RNA helicase